jgi:hypothetical protein
MLNIKKTRLLGVNLSNSDNVYHKIAEIGKLKMGLPISCLTESVRYLYWQPGNLKDAMRVLQLNDPLAFRYSVVYQKVQSSTGSTVMAL